MSNESVAKKAGSESQKTQRKILELLKVGGARASNELALELGVTSMAVRLHLYDLQEQGHVTTISERRARGRPVKLWQLTESAQEFFPDRHGDLLVSLLATAQKALGSSALDSIIDARAEEQRITYREALAVHDELGDKVRELAQLRTAEGYMADCAVSADGAYLLIENNCPICAAAKSCQRFCFAELSVFAEALGDGVDVERTEHLMSGSRRCVYRISPREAVGSSK